MRAISHKVNESLYLVRHTVDSGSKPVEVQAPVNHVAVIDCSGSMSSDLPRLRDQFKRRIPKLLRDGDTLSIIWFSGRGQFGVLIEGEPISSLTDLQEMNLAIDKLRPVGMTGFKDPIEEVARLASRMAAKHPGPLALFFMSDGQDNEWPRQDVLKAVDSVAGVISSVTIVEYGYYADRPFLTKMAERSGGSLIFAEDFDRYAPAFEAALQRRVQGSKKLEVKIGADAIGGFAFSRDGSDLLTFSVDAGKITVPSGTKEVCFLSPSPVGDAGAGLEAVSKFFDLTVPAGRTASDPQLEPVISAAYAATSLYAHRMRSDVVLPLLKSIGDVSFIEQFASCFGKQRYSDFTTAVGQASTGSGRFKAGWNPNKVPRDDAFTVLELLQVLAEDDGNLLVLDHPAFKYNRIGRGRSDAASLTSEEMEQIRDLTEQLAKAKDAKSIKSLTGQIDAITAAKADPLKFVAEEVPGLELDDLVYNEERPNVSVRVKRRGTVDLSSAEIPSGSNIPSKFPTFVYRNYTFMKDGLTNVDVLPARLTEKTLERFNAVVSSGRSPSFMTLQPDGVTLLDLKVLPAINRKQINEVSAKDLFTLEYELTKARAAQKVFSSFRKELLPDGKKSDGFSVLYGQPGAEWLKGLGFTDYGGFNPKQAQSPSTDFYMGKELAVSLKGLSSLPSLKEVREKMAKGKPTPSASLMIPYVKEVEAFLASPTYVKASNQPKLLAAWLDGEGRSATLKVRSLLFAKAQTVFTVVVGQVWFKEFSSLDENSMQIAVDGLTLDCKVEQKEVRINL